MQIYSKSKGPTNDFGKSFFHIADLGPLYWGAIPGCNIGSKQRSLSKRHL